MFARPPRLPLPKVDTSGLSPAQAEELQHTAEAISDRVQGEFEAEWTDTQARFVIENAELYPRLAPKLALERDALELARAIRAAAQTPEEAYAATRTDLDDWTVEHD